MVDAEMLSQADKSGKRRSAGRSPVKTPAAGSETFGARTTPAKGFIFSNSAQLAATTNNGASQLTGHANQTTEQLLGANKQLNQQIEV